MKHLSYDDGTYRAEIDIHQATTGDGIQRGLLMYDLPKDDKLPFRARTLFANISVVSTFKELTCRVGTPESGLPQYADIQLTPESMLALPDALTALWELKVLDENPQWRYGLNSDQLEELQKKLRKPSDGSENSTEPQTKAAKAKM
jgi:hypothetical protein